MTSVSIYTIPSEDHHIHKTMMGKLLEKVWKQGRQVIVSCHEGVMQEVDNWLWHYSQISFLPHITEDDLRKDPSMVDNNKIFIIHSRDANQMIPDKDVMLNTTGELEDANTISGYDRYLYFLTGQNGNDSVVKKISEHIQNMKAQEMKMEVNIFSYCHKMEKWQKR